MSEEDYERTLQLFSEFFGVTYSESEELKRSNKDLETLQCVVIPTLYKTFKRITTTYGELTELCTTSEKSRKISQKREEMSALYKQNFRYLVFATRLFLLYVQEIGDDVARDTEPGEQSLSSLPVKVIHELLGSPGTKECVVFLMDLALLQGNRLLADQLFDYLVGFPSSVQNECYLARRRLSEFCGHSFSHQLLPITNNFDCSRYFPGLSEKETSIALILFKVKNLMRSLWNVAKSYLDLMKWWRENYLEILSSVQALQVSELYDQLENTRLEDLPLSAFFESSEHWQVSTLCGVTGYVLYITYQSILDGNELVEEAVTSFHFESQGYRASQLVSEAIKFSLLSLLLDPANYKAAWLLSLLHLSSSEHFSLLYSLKFVTLTMSLNPSFDDSWVLYSLLWTSSLLHDHDHAPHLAKSHTFLSSRGAGRADSAHARPANISPISITCKMISLASKDDNLRIPLQFTYIGYCIFQIFRNREGNDDLCYGVISDIIELNQWLLEQKAHREKEVETEKSPAMSNVSISPSSKSKKSRDAKAPYLDQTEKSSPELYSDSSPVITHPLLFKLQLLIWSLKLKMFLGNDGLHICSESIAGQIDEFIQLHKETLEKDLDLLDELHVHSHIRHYLKMQSDRFSAIFRDGHSGESGLHEAPLISNEPKYDDPQETRLLSQSQSGSLFEADLIDWRALLSPIHNLY
ncbi:hypothetical protein OJ252_1383 [Cryptosporidium canis]|uniref:Uncharacterized protein n=1 Tax=Cryptosporidium canis TaxID=195482 RepID=A0ABQ8P8A0_9CRYT|nr:hypothetical protein OJ252_1383 [Cryptosporidium canis]